MKISKEMRTRFEEEEEERDLEKIMRKVRAETN
jgi:hypothetical protein